jgi:multiple sugar transport system permease protein
MALSRSERHELAKGLAFISPWLIGFAAFTVLPIALSAYYSFNDYPMTRPPLYVGTANYVDLLHDSVFGKALFNTLYYAAVALPLAMITALSLAILLNSKVRGQMIYRTLIFLPSLVPAVASALIWLWLYNTKLGLINLLLHRIGISYSPPWLSDTAWAMPALILMSVWSVGNTVVIYLAALQDVPRELLEAAELDGAGVVGRIIHVTLPTISPVIFFNLIMAIIGTLQVFTIPAIMTQGKGSPDRSLYFFTMYLYDAAFRYVRMGQASAMAWVQLLIVLALTGIAFWSSKKWVHYQGK